MIVKRNQSFEILDYNQKNIDYYKSKDNLLKHARCNKNTDGIMLISSKTKELIGYCAWERDMIIALEVIKEFRNQSYGEYLVKKAVSNGCNKLTTSINNTPAIKLYEKLGFQVVNKIGSRITMKIK